MKNTKTCPKCKCREIVIVPGSVGLFGSGNNIPLDWLKYITVSRYLCCGCGFSEEWIENQEDREKIKAAFAVQSETLSLDNFRPFGDVN
jgi:hypothetical protein